MGQATAQNHHLGRTGGWLQRVADLRKPAAPQCGVRSQLDRWCLALAVSANDFDACRAKPLGLALQSRQVSTIEFIGLAIGLPGGQRTTLYR